MRRLIFSLLCGILLSGLSLSATQMEAGTFSMPGTSSGFFNVNFQQSYDQTPLVFTLMDFDGTNSAIYRVKNVTQTGFQSTIAEPMGFDGPHTNTTLRYVAITPGVYRLPDGTLLEAGTVDTQLIQRSNSQVAGTVGRENISFQGQFGNTPALLSAIQTLNNETNNIPQDTSQPWMTAGVDNVTNTGTELFLERGPNNDGGVISVDETIGYLAMEQGTGSFQDSNGKNILYEALRSAANIIGYTGGTQVSLQQSYSSAPIVVATKNTRNQEDGWIRLANGRITNNTVDLGVDENQFTSGQNHSVGEAAGITAFSESFVLNGLAQENVTNNAAVPEPGSVVLLFTAIILAAGVKRRREER